jgi:hypothetical protein
MSAPQYPPERPLDLLALLRTLAEHGVEHLVIGGIAVQVHGHRRTMKDLDVMPAPAPGNHERLARALEALDARVSGVEPDAVDVVTRHGELHVLNAPKGAADYDAMRARALVVEIEGIEVAIAGLDDLIRMKHASARQSDFDDIAVLTAIERGSG